MKRTFEVRVNDDEGLRIIDLSVLEHCLRTEDSLGSRVELDIKVVSTEGGDGSTEQDVYKRLLNKVNNEIDADSCCCWAGALKRFCEAIRIKAGG